MFGGGRDISHPLPSLLAMGSSSQYDDTVEITVVKTLCPPTRPLKYFWVTSVTRTVRPFTVKGHSAATGLLIEVSKLAKAAVQLKRISNGET